jgi:hypothetical protein
MLIQWITKASPANTQCRCLIWYIIATNLISFEEWCVVRGIVRRVLFRISSWSGKTPAVHEYNVLAHNKAAEIVWICSTFRLSFVSESESIVPLSGLTTWLIHSPTTIGYSVTEGLICYILEEASRRLVNLRHEAYSNWAKGKMTNSYCFRKYVSASTATITFTKA